MDFLMRMGHLSPLKTFVFYRLPLFKSFFTEKVFCKQHLTFLFFGWGGFWSLFMRQALCKPIQSPLINATNVLWENTSPKLRGIFLFLARWWKIVGIIGSKMQRDWLLIYNGNGGDSIRSALRSDRCFVFFEALHLIRSECFHSVL